MAFNSYGSYTSNDWDEEAQNMGIPGRGQFAPTDAPKAPNAGYSQPPAAAPQGPQAPGPWAPAPPQQVPSGRDAQDPTRMAGAPLTPPISQGGLQPDVVRPPTAAPSPFAGASAQFQQSLQADPRFAANPVDTRPKVEGQQGFVPPAPTLQMGAMNYSQMGRGAAQVNPMSFSGFNHERALSGGDVNSAKDAFRDIVGSSGIDVRGLSKEQVGEVLATQLIPLLESKGYPARAIPGEYDRIQIFSNERGWETKDVVAKAGSGEAEWWWGDDAPAMAPDQGAINPALMQQAASGADPEMLAAAQSLGIDTDNNPLWRQMLAQYYASENGQPQAPLDFSA
jgi:hypothetical protein